MKYELLSSGRGVLIDRTPILRDIRDTYAVSFLLPSDGSYIAQFKGIDAAEYRKAITDGVCKIPKELLMKEQYVEVIVSKIDGDKVLQSWTCESLKITAFLSLRKSQWQLSGGMTDKDCLDRLAELERLYSDALIEFAKFKEELKALQNKFDSLVINEDVIKALSENQSILQENIKRLTATVESLK